MRFSQHLKSITGRQIVLESCVVVFVLSHIYLLVFLVGMLSQISTYLFVARV